MSMNVSQQETQYKKPGVGAIIGGTIAGGLVQNTVTGMQQGIGLASLINMGKLSENLSPDEFNKIAKATKDVMENSGLSKAGVEVLKNGTNNNLKINRAIYKEINNNILLKHQKIKKLEIITNTLKKDTLLI